MQLNSKLAKHLQVGDLVVLSRNPGDNSEELTIREVVKKVSQRIFILANWPNNTQKVTHETVLGDPDSIKSFNHIFHYLLCEFPIKEDNIYCTLTEYDFKNGDFTINLLGVNLLYFIKSPDSKSYLSTYLLNFEDNLTTLKNLRDKVKDWELFGDFISDNDLEDEWEVYKEMSDNEDLINELISIKDKKAAYNFLIQQLPFLKTQKR